MSETGNGDAGAVLEEGEPVEKVMCGILRVVRAARESPILTNVSSTVDGRKFYKEDQRVERVLIMRQVGCRLVKVEKPVMARVVQVRGMTCFPTENGKTGEIAKVNISCYVDEVLIWVSTKQSQDIMTGIKRHSYDPHSSSSH